MMIFEIYADPAGVTQLPASSNITLVAGTTPSTASL